VVGVDKTGKQHVSGKIHDLIGCLRQGHGRPNLLDEAVHNEQTTVDDLSVAIIHRRKNLRMPNKKCAHT